MRLFAQEPSWSQHAPTPQELLFHVLSPLLLQNQVQSCSSVTSESLTRSRPSALPRSLLTSPGDVHVQAPLQLGVGNGAACNFLLLRRFGPKAAAFVFNEQTNPGL